MDRISKAQEIWYHLHQVEQLTITEALDLEDHFGHWGEHPDHPVANWQVDVSDNETRLGYWHWVESKLQDFPEDDT